MLRNRHIFYTVIFKASFVIVIVICYVNTVCWFFFFENYFKGFLTMSDIIFFSLVIEYVCLHLLFLWLSDEDDGDEPEEVKQAWDELLLIQREQQRYTDIKYDLEQDLEHCKKKQTKLEDVSSNILKKILWSLWLHCGK